MTRIAAACLRIRDGDISANLSAMEKAARRAKEAGAELCCFGECALQGFNCLDWHFEDDRTVGVSVESDLFRTLCSLSREIGIDLLFGFIEREGESLYSSCALLSGGRLFHLYRRVSRGWKEYGKTDGHYREGDEILPFKYRGMRCLVALCGDLWDDTADRFRLSGIDLLLWPVYICYSPEEWDGGIETEYAEKAAEFARKAVLINSIGTLDGKPDAFGGCAFFEDGKTSARLPMNEEGILLIDL